MGLTQPLVEKWRIESRDQLRKIHATLDGHFVLSGGLYFPSKPQSYQSCAMALIESDSGRYKWYSTLSSNMAFEHSCVTNRYAIGVIPSRHKSELYGLLYFDIAAGRLIDDGVKEVGINGIANIDDSTLACSVWKERSKLMILSNSRSHSIELSSDSNFRIATISPGIDGRLITTMQYAMTKNGKGYIEFVHQMRKITGEIIWEFRSTNESLFAMPDGIIVAFSNAGEGRKSELEFVDEKTGNLVRKISISSSIANPIAIAPDTLVFCNPNYELCVYDLMSETYSQRIAFPNATPGWLTFACNTSSRIILACKADNFLSPKSTVAAFLY